MGPTAIIATTCLVSREEFRAFARAEGALDDEDGVYDGWLSGRTHCVYLRWASDDQKDALRRAQLPSTDPLASDERKRFIETGELINSLLGNAPQTYIQVDLFRGLNSQPVAWRFIKDFCRRWQPCVLRSTMPVHLADNGKRVWVMDEVAAFFAAHHRLPN